MKNRKKVSFLSAPDNLDRVLKGFHKKWVLWNLFFEVIWRDDDPYCVKVNKFGLFGQNGLVAWKNVNIQLGIGVSKVVLYQLELSYNIGLDCCFLVASG